MLEPIMHVLKAQKVIVASSSIRRQQVLANTGLTFDVIPPICEENLNKDDYSTPYEYAIATASLKGLDVAARIEQTSRPNLIISADTVVVCDGVLYEKPKNEADAFRMLSKLSGSVHTVYTGVVLIQQKAENAPVTIRKFHEATEVIIPHLPPQVINAYIATKEPMDKAGGYGIQGFGGTLIQGIRGDYYNVMGLPLHRFCLELIDMYGPHQ